MTPDSHPTEKKLELLLEITSRISRSRDLGELLVLVMDTLPLLVPYDAAGIYVLETPEPVGGRAVTQRVLRTRATRGYDSDTPTHIRLESREGLTSRVVETGRSVNSPDVTRDARYVRLRDATRSELVAPIISNDEVIGIFDLESDEPGAYAEEDTRVLAILASQVALIMEKVMLLEQQLEKRRLEAQLEVARQVQLFLLPDRTPRVENFDIAAYNFSTEEVSGDYYDFASDYADQLKFVIADVSGKGIPAGLLMAFLRGSLRSAMQTGYATSVAMAKMNALLWESTEQNQYVTAVHGVLDATNRTLSFSNAGHNPPLLLDQDGSCRYLFEGETPLGMFERTRYYEYFLKLESGQTLILYTDGATEAADARGEEFGRDRLARTAREACRLPARELIDCVYDDILRHTGGQRPTDDVTFVVIRSLSVPP